MIFTDVSHFEFTVRLLDRTNCPETCNKLLNRIEGNTYPQSLKQLIHKGSPLTHWGRVTHICVGNLTIIGPDNGLSPGWRQAIIWTNAGILLIGPLGTNLHRNSYIFIQENVFQIVVWKMAAILSWPQCVKFLSWYLSKMGRLHQNTLWSEFNSLWNICWNMMKYMNAFLHFFTIYWNPRVNHPSHQDPVTMMVTCGSLFLLVVTLWVVVRKVLPTQFLNKWT